jgi:hypothetical protein
MRRPILGTVLFLGVAGCNAILGIEKPDDSPLLLADGGVQCPQGLGECNGDPSDGCETPTSEDLENCGACGVVCASINAQATCIAGTCQLSCGAPFADCDGHPSNGCETDTTSDPDHCGACKNACGSGNRERACSGSTCSAKCAATFHKCSGQCFSDTSPESCGTSCTPCPGAPNAVATCTAGICGTTCAPDAKDCNGSCKAVKTDAENCGACGRSCGGGACSNGVCGSVLVASGLNNPRTVVATTNYLLVTTADSQTSIQRVDKTTGQLATALPLGGTSARYLQGAGSKVYWIRDSVQLWSQSETGGDATSLIQYAGGASQKTDFQIADGKLVVLRADTVNRCTLPGNVITGTTCTSSPECSGLGAGAYCAGQFQSTIRSFDLDGGSEKVLLQTALGDAQWSVVGFALKNDTLVYGLTATAYSNQTSTWARTGCTKLQAIGVGPKSPLMATPVVLAAYEPSTTPASVFSVRSQLDVVTDGSYAYFQSAGGCSVADAGGIRVPIQGGQWTKVAQYAAPWNTWVGAGEVFFNLPYTTSDLFRLDSASGVVTKWLVPQPQLSAGFDADGSWVYYSVPASGTLRRQRR